MRRKEAAEGSVRTISGSVVLMAQRVVEEGEQQGAGEEERSDPSQQHSRVRVVSEELTWSFLPPHNTQQQQRAESSPLLC